MGICKATTTSGRECGSPALLEQDVCFFHSSAREAERLQASAKGGSAPRRTGIDLGKALARPEILDDPMRIAALLETMIGGATSGRVTPHQLRAVTAAARVLLQALDAGDVRAQLDELRAAVERIEGGRVLVPPR